MSWSCDVRRVAGLTAVAMVTTVPPAMAQPTPGYPEKVVQWTVKAGESCTDIARAMYGDAAKVGLVLRYNRVSCTAGAPLAEGLTLTLPATVTNVPSARLTSVNPETRSRPAGGGWSTAAPGQPLGSSSAVNTLEEGRAGIRFIDRSRVYLASNTLVIIYGTAAQSQVSKSRPAKVKLDRGELQAGLAALRGDRVDVDVEGGGRVSAASRDTVLRRQGKRTNVSVFDGDAQVESAGQKVKVPTNYGTRFVSKKPPEPPRPLPPAPAWTGVSPVVSFALDGQGGVLASAWEPMPKAKLYRLELARDAKFEDLVSREQVPADVTAFRAEGLKPGRYYARVRGIDTDDFLGIASAVRTIDVVAARWKRGRGSLDQGAFEVGRYAVLALEPPRGVELATDDGAFAPLPAELDFSRLHATKLRFRHRTPGAPVQPWAIRVREPKATIALDRQGGSLRLRVRLSGLDEVDVSRDVGPRLRVVTEAGETMLPLVQDADGSYTAQASLVGDVVRIDAIDQHGRVLGTLTPDVDAGPAPEPEGVPYPIIGVSVPLWPLSPRLNTPWTAPTAPAVGALGGLVESDGDPVSLQGFAWGSGSIGPVGIDAVVRTRAGQSDREDDSGAWLGVRYRAYRLGHSEVELAPLLRVGVPLDEEGPDPQLEPGITIGGAVASFTWLSQLGGRVRLGPHDEARSFTDAGQVYLLGGGTYDPLSWMRLHASIDAHLLIPGETPVLFRGGLSGGIEMGTTFFVSLSGRMSPWNDMGGYGAGQLALGVRDWWVLPEGEP